ncbi:DeoR/GlpR family DNA-binding transcription regulator [Desulfosporosinus sp. SB140]|uniref:DeoR/GlpR family DNA-binding transcription regulator n=1 Tax=Desulfosporosinus paludis TaxID=3115649 RepID=UPI0038908C95
MLAIVRRQKIAEIIHKDRKVYVSDLSQLFSVTEETIRRDLEKLESEGLLTRTYGGAITSQHTNEDLPFPLRTTMNLESKQVIAAKAATLINDGDTIAIDASTTCSELMQTLGKSKVDLTVITNSVKIPCDFISSKFNIISTGGTLRAHSFALTGPVAQSTIENYYVDIAIMSCKSLSLDKGIMESNEPEGEIKKKMIQQAEKTILLVDHSKFDKTSFVKLFEFDSFNYIVTDREPASVWMELFRKYDIQVIY